MNTLELFLRNHAIVHGLELGEPEGQFSLEYNCLHGLTDEQLRIRPGGSEQTDPMRLRACRN